MHTLPNLPASVAREAFAAVCGLLPPWPADTPEARADREETAMAAVVALAPGDAFEALLAAQIVGADAHAKDCLRLAVAPGADAEAAHRCRAQAACMMRQMQSGLRALQRRQAAREKAEAALEPAAMERAGYWFREIEVPPPAPAPAPEDAPALTDAEEYAVIYPDRAARIRAARGLPRRLDFAPPEPALVDAIVTGSSPILRALDPPAPVQAAA